MVIETVILSVFGSITAIVIAGKLERRHHIKRLYVLPCPFSEFCGVVKLDSCSLQCCPFYSRQRSSSSNSSCHINWFNSKVAAANYHVDIHQSEDESATSGEQGSASKKNTILEGKDLT